MQLQACFVRLGVLLVLMIAAVLSCSTSAFAETKTFLATEGSERTFPVPAGVTQIQITAVGGAGKPGSVCVATHSYPGGAGAKVTATLDVSEGKTLYVDFGGGGIGGVETCVKGAGEGGGASDVRTEQGNLKSRLIVAGGGGGGGSSVRYETSGLMCEQAGAGGSASALEGEAGATGLVEFECGFGRNGAEGTGGGGGKEGGGGKGGAEAGTTCPGSEGSEGVGGNGGPQSSNNCGDGGGGGGGYYGGGGGGGGGFGAGGGGAGSSYYAPGATNTSVKADSTDPQEVLITYATPSSSGEETRKHEEEVAAAAAKRSQEEAAARKHVEEEAAAKKHAEEEVAIAARVHSALIAVLRPHGKAAKLGAITKAGGYIVAFAAPTSGIITIAWYEVPKGAHISSAKPILVATGTAKVGAIGTVKVHVRLTAKGRQLLRHARNQKLTAKATFTPTGKTGFTAIGTFTLRRS